MYFEYVKLVGGLPHTARWYGDFECAGPFPSGTLESGSSMTWNCWKFDVNVWQFHVRFSDQVMQAYISLSLPEVILEGSMTAFFIIRRSLHSTFPKEASNVFCLFYTNYRSNCKKSFFGGLGMAFECAPSAILPSLTPFLV